MDDAVVTIGPAPRATVLSALVLGALGLLAGLVLPLVAGWVLSLPWAPLQGPLELLLRIDAVVPVWVLPLVGTVAGAGLAVVGSADEPVVTVSSRDLVITRGRQRTRFARSQVAEALVERHHLVVRDAADVELAHQKVGGDPGELAAALRHHGWPGSAAPG